MRKYISNRLNQPTSADVATMVNKALELLEPYTSPLTHEERRGMRTMAQGREGLVRLIASIATQHEDSLSRQDNAAELTDALTDDTQLETIRQAAIELVTDMQVGNSADIMILSDAYTQSLQASRKRKSSLDAAMGEVDEWNKRYVNKGNQDNELPLVS